MKRLDSMSLAHKIYKNQIKFFKLFSFSESLKLAWKLCKKAKVLLEDGMIILKNSVLKDYQFCISTTRSRNAIKFEDNERNFKLFLYEFNHGF